MGLCEGYKWWYTGLMDAQLRKADLTSLAREQTQACINVLFSILSDADAPVSVRIKAAKMLLSRDPTNRSLSECLVSLCANQRPN